MQRPPLGLDLPFIGFFVSLNCGSMRGPSSPQRVLEQTAQYVSTLGSAWRAVLRIHYKKDLIKTVNAFKKDGAASIGVEGHMSMRDTKSKRLEKPPRFEPEKQDVAPLASGAQQVTGDCCCRAAVLWWTKALEPQRYACTPLRSPPRDSRGGHSTIS